MNTNHLIRTRLSSADRMALQKLHGATAHRIDEAAERFWVYELPYSPHVLHALRHKRAVWWSVREADKAIEGMVMACMGTATASWMAHARTVAPPFEALQRQLASCEIMQTLRIAAHFKGGAMVVLRFDVLNKNARP